MRLGILAGAAICVLGTAAISETAPKAGPAASIPASAPGEARMQRLSQAQYANVIASAFGPEVSLSSRLEPAPRTHGLLAIGLGKAAISASGMEAAVTGAMDIAAQVTGKGLRDKLISCKPADATKFDQKCARTFLSETGLKLYRRPLSKGEVDAAVALSKASAERLKDFHAGLRFGLVSLLTAPDFLFRVEHVEPDPQARGAVRLDGYSKASRLSFYLTDGPPDAELIAAARDGSIHRPEVLAAQADRLIASPLFERGTRAFFKDMFAFDAFQALTKDANLFPVYDGVIANDAQEETLRLVVDQLVTRGGDYGGIFTRNDTFLSRSLGWVYKVPVAEREGWERQLLTPESRRGGLFTHISFLALHSHPGRSSPTLRGKFVREVFLCQTIPPPPANVDFTLFEKADSAALKTARARLDAHRTDKTCNGCHRLMDPIGFAMEGFDAIGGSRPLENGEPIDTSGEIDGTKFDDARGLGKAIASSDRAKQCIATQSFQYGLGREMTRTDRPMVDQAVAQFKADGFRYKTLVRSIATSDGFYAVSAPAPLQNAKQQVARNDASSQRKGQP